MPRLDILTGIKFKERMRSEIIVKDRGRKTGFEIRINSLAGKRPIVFHRKKWKTH